MWFARACMSRRECRLKCDALSGEPREGFRNEQFKVEEDVVRTPDREPGIEALLALDAEITVACSMDSLQGTKTYTATRRLITRNGEIGMLAPRARGSRAASTLLASENSIRFAVPYAAVDEAKPSIR